MFGSDALMWWASNPTWNNNINKCYHSDPNHKRDQVHDQTDSVSNLIKTMWEIVMPKMVYYWPTKNKKSRKTVNMTAQYAADNGRQSKWWFPVIIQLPGMQIHSSCLAIQWIIKFMFLLFQA